MSDNKFAKNSRLLSAADFSNLKIESFTFKRPSIIIYYKRNSLGHSRLGLSVSKKIGNSPIRNRFKRILREFYRNSSIRNLEVDILIVVSFSRTHINEGQELKEKALLNNTNEFFQFLLSPK